MARADILLGHSGDLSGTSAALTKDYLRGMNAYFDEVNRKGGIHGEKIKLVSLDDGFNPDKTAENTKALIDQNALALVGYRGTANVLKIVPLCRPRASPRSATPAAPSRCATRTCRTCSTCAPAPPTRSRPRSTTPGPSASRASPRPTRTTPSARKASRR